MNSVESDTASSPAPSTWLYSLLLAGVTSTSTLCLLGFEQLFEGQLAQAAPLPVTEEGPEAIATEFTPAPDQQPEASGAALHPDQPLESDASWWDQDFEALAHQTQPLESDASWWDQDFEALANPEQPVETDASWWDQDFEALANADRSPAALTDLSPTQEPGNEPAAIADRSAVAAAPATQIGSEHGDASEFISTAIATETTQVVQLQVDEEILEPIAAGEQYFNTIDLTSVDEFDVFRSAAIDQLTESEEYASGTKELTDAAEIYAAAIDSRRHSESALTDTAVAQADDNQVDSTSTPESNPEPPNLENAASTVSQAGSDLLGRPFVRLQGAYVLQGDESSARLRATGTYIVTPNLMFGATVDLSTGNAFIENDNDGLNLSELYVTYSPTDSSNLRLTLGLMDLTSYFDRNSFAKDAVTHFFNPVFQTNPALVASGISAARLGLLVNWSPFDNLDLKAAAFSSDQDLGDFAIDAFAAEIGLRVGNLIVRGTYASNEDADDRTGFQEIFQFSRNDGRDFGLVEGDREESFGINAEYFIPELKLGLFGRYGHYQNLDLDRGGDTFSFGINLLDLFFAADRLGLGYGRLLSNDSLRRDRDEKTPDVLELFYDVRLTRNLRAGATLQFRNQFSETVAGFRIRADFDVK